MRAYFNLTGIIFIFISIIACGQANNNYSAHIANSNNTPSNHQNPIALTTTSRFPEPPGYKRLDYNNNSFQYYLSHFPLKAIDAKVFYYDGRLKPNQWVSASVLDIDIGTKNLQQCADAVIRLRAEYLFEHKRFAEIHFRLTNGFRADYSEWREGYRIKLSGNKTSWYKSANADSSYKCFKDYLNLIFTYAGTLSLSKELTAIPSDSLQIGDVFIHGGSPGHAVIIMDVAINPSNHKKVFIIAQSYMPAQNIHLLVNDQDKDLSPWYDLSRMDKMYSPEWTFEKSDLKRF